MRARHNLATYATDLLRIVIILGRSRPMLLLVHLLAWAWQSVCVCWCVCKCLCPYQPMRPNTGTALVVVQFYLIAISISLISFKYSKQKVLMGPSAVGCHCCSSLRAARSLAGSCAQSKAMSRRGRRWGRTRRLDWSFEFEF